MPLAWERSHAVVGRRGSLVSRAIALGLVVALIAAPASATAAAPASASATATATAAGDELTPGGDFSAGAGAWWATPDMIPSIDTSSGAFCVDVPGGGGDPWSSIVGIDNVVLTAGEHYRLAATLSGTAPRTIRVLAQQGASPWTATFEANPTMTVDPTALEWAFTSTLDLQTGQLVFQIGGADDPWRFCLDDVSLQTGSAPVAYVPPTQSRIRVNQIGYVADGPKRATLLTEADAPLPWVLKDADGETVATGETEPLGLDRTVASVVHRIDLGAVRATGAGFTIEADAQVSAPFSIGALPYTDLAHDALRYFLLARSGIELTADVVGESYARPAGHIGVAPNQGDLDVGCQAPQPWYDGWTCGERYDVSGGWYDAGDHGKYVVNGGIAVHQLLDVWERADRAGAQALVADGALGVPESGNGIPDVLDEARWELEWMARMQVPAGDDRDGMVFHKVQDDGWTGLPLPPWEDGQPRAVHRPSTAATLNFAAVAAKAARLWAELDPEFAADMLERAQVAWAAALAEPDLFASADDGNNGGGPYDDRELDDEFLWAAAELAITTGEAEFIDAVAANPMRTAALETMAMDWASTTGLAIIDLATTPGGADLPFRDEAIVSITRAADRYLELIERDAFGSPYASASGEYEWGSNGLVANRMVLMATAFDLTGDDRYRDGVLEGMDGLLGRNGVDLSFVTGYGTVFAQNQHHRWMAPSLDASLPPVADGTLAGGPNSSIQDPVAQRLWPDGCSAARTCYVDDIQSWSTNEMTVNWNSALAWVATWLAAETDAPPASSDDGSPQSPTNEPLNPTGLIIAAVLIALGAATLAVVISRRRAKESDRI